MRLRRIAPAFGHVVEDPKAAISSTLERYSATDDLIVKALKGGATSSEEVVASQYSSVDDPTANRSSYQQHRSSSRKTSTERRRLNSLNLAGKFDKNPSSTTC